MKLLKIMCSLVFALSVAASVNAQALTDIKKIDFTNFTHRIKTASVKIKSGLQVGSCSKDAEGSATGEIWNVDKGNIAYGDLTGDGNAEAIVPMAATICGANMVTDEAVLVYTLKGGKPTKLPEFEYFDEGCKEDEEGCNVTRVPGVTVKYDVATKTIAIANYFATEDDARCCPSFLRKTWFRWDKTKFVELKKGKLEADKPEEL